MSKPDLAYAFGLKPEAAIEYFKAKGYAVSWDWNEVWQDAHARAFTVAKAMRADILQDIRTMVQKGLEDGITYQQFKKELTPQLKAKGWWGEIVNEQTGEIAVVGPHRLRTIYETNIQTAYMTGHYQQAMENVADRPWWMYVAVMDKRTRPAHSALNGLVFRYDDPFWNTHHPQNGFRCRCGVRYLDDYRLEQKIKDGTAAKRSTAGPDADSRLETIEKPLNKAGDMVPVTSMKTKDLSGNTVSMAPDPGWNFNPGKAGSSPAELLASKLPRWDADLGAAMYQSDKGARKAVKENYGEWLSSALSGNQRKDYALLGSMGPVEINFLDSLGRKPQNSAIIINDRLVAGKKAERHRAAGNGLSEAEWRMLPDVVDVPETVLYDNLDGKLLYVHPALDDPRKIKIVVEQDVTDKKLDNIMNQAVTVFKIDSNALADVKRYKKIR